MSVPDFLKIMQDYSADNVFNPYRNVCDQYDTIDSPKLRFRVLNEILQKAEKNKVDAIWLGRDLGHRGGRRTGLAFTDDLNVENHLKRWNVINNPFTYPEIPVKEQTASTIWSKLQNIDEKIFLWNIFPFHPYEMNEPLTNRCHNKQENIIGKQILLQLIEMLQPKKILAIGNDAFNSVQQLNIEVNLKKARHPSYGGKNDFLEAIYNEYGV